MAFVLSSGDVELRVERAGERYRWCRFDWNGLVSSLRYRGVELLGQERPLFSRNDRKFGRGLHNEFGISACVGYDDCAVGEWFPKIGVGWLKKDAKPYFFFTEYEREAIAFDCERSADGTDATFVCESGNRNGYAYRYEKRIRAAGSGLSVRYRLENSGEKPIVTDEYTHNFLRFGGRRMEKGYALSFPHEIDPARFAKTVDPDGILSVEKNRVAILGKTRKQFYIGGITAAADGPDGPAGPAGYAGGAGGAGAIRGEAGLSTRWTLVHAGLGVSLSERGSFAPSAVHLWGWKDVISPEVFFPIRAEPGSAVEWERVYEAGPVRAADNTR